MTTRRLRVPPRAPIRDNKGVFNLLGFPPELRLEIYRCWLSIPNKEIILTEESRGRFVSYHEDPHIVNFEWVIWPKHHLSLLGSCRLIHGEATPILYHCLYSQELWFHDYMELLHFLEAHSLSRKHIVSVAVAHFDFGMLHDSEEEWSAISRLFQIIVCDSGIRRFECREMGYFLSIWHDNDAELPIRIRRFLRLVEEYLPLIKSVELKDCFCGLMKELEEDLSNA